MSPPKQRRPASRRPPARGLSPRLSVLAVCGFLLAAVAIVFGQTVGHDFVDFDDSKYVYENPQVCEGLTAEGIGWAFTSSHACNWHPLTWLSHMLDCQFYGRNPAGHHLTNVLLHAATAIVLFLVLQRATGDLWPSALAAALFAIHPLRAESVAWVAERKDVLSGLFFMLTLAAYAAYVRWPLSIARYLIVVLLFVLGLMAKPMLVTLPFVLLLLDYWPLGRFAPSSGARSAPTRAAGLSPGSAIGSTTGSQAPVWERAARVPKPELGTKVKVGSKVNEVRQRSEVNSSAWPRLVIEKIPLLALAAASCGVTLLVQQAAMSQYRALPMSQRIANALVSYVDYVVQLFYPVGLTVLYPWSERSLPVWKIGGALLVLGGISGAVWLWRRRCPYLLVGWLWYLGMLVPVIGLVQVGPQALADRYTYLPHVGLCVALAWMGAEACRAWPARRWAPATAAALFLAAMMGCAWRQTTYWRDSETLWTHALACSSQNSTAHLHLGNRLAEKGCYDDAIEHLQAAARIDPDDAMIHVDLANTLCEKGDREDAIGSYQRALQIDPDILQAHRNLAVLFSQAGRPEPAIEHYQHAVELSPDSAPLRFSLGVALAEQGRYQDAVRQWQRGLSLKPDEISIILLTAWVLATNPDPAVRDGAQAVELAERANRLAGGREPAVLDVLAAAYAEARRFAEAVEIARRALDLASAQGNAAVADALRAQSQLYQAGRPFRDTDRSLVPGATQRTGRTGGGSSR